MPRITYNQDGSGGVVSFGHEDWLSGFAPQASNNSNKVIGTGAMFMREFDPFRSLGFAAPGFSPVDVTNVSVTTALQNNGVVNNGATPYAYTVGGTRTNRLDLSNDTYSNAGDWPHSIVGATMEDCVIYRYGGTKYLFASYYDGTDLEVMRYDLASTFVDNFWSGTLSLNSADQNVPHPMIIGTNGRLYIGDGEDIGFIDGDSSTGGISDLDLPPGFVITSFSRLPDYLVLYAYKSEGLSSSNYYRGDARAFLWDYQASTYNFEYDLEDNYVNGGFNWRGDIGCFTYGRAKDAQGNLMAMRMFDGTRFAIPPKFVPTSDNPPGHGGVEIVDNMLHWNSSGKIYSFGSIIPELPDAMIHRTSGLGTTGFGMLKNFAGAKLYASTGTTTSGGMQTLSSNYNENSFFTSLMAEPNFPLNHYGEVDYVQVKFSDIATGGRVLAMTLRTDRGQTTTNILVDVSDVTVQTTAESATSKRLLHETNVNTSSADLPNFSSIGIALDWGTGVAATAAPIVSEVNIFFKNIPLPS